MSDDIVYPSIELILDLHEQVVDEGDATEPGVLSEEAIASALHYISDGFFGEVPLQKFEEKAHELQSWDESNMTLHTPPVDGTAG